MRLGERDIPLPVSDFRISIVNHKRLPPVKAIPNGNRLPVPPVERVKIDMRQPVASQHVPEECCLAAGLNADEENHLHCIFYLKWHFHMLSGYILILLLRHNNPW